MIKEIFFVFWFFFPTGLANVAAFCSGKIPYIKSFSYPVDFNKKFRGKRILGDHKTIRGFIFGIVVGVITVYIQILLFQNFKFLRDIIPIDYNSINPVILGGLEGFGALFGDSFKSFFKRQMGILPGKSWFPFDQIDYVLGAIFFTALYIPLSLIQYVTVFVLGFLIHYTTRIFFHT